jgi:MFS superfamily sulfate permease-like transporter
MLPAGSEQRVAKELSMRNIFAAFGFHFLPTAGWRDDWVWGVPLIVVTVLLHLLGLWLVNQRAFLAFRRMMQRRHPMAIFVMVMATVTLLSTMLLAIEAGIWATAYQFLGARPDFKSAMLYSLGAMTTYGHAELQLQDQWQLLGTIEALDGWLLFGLTTAFMFGMIQKVLLLNSGEVHQKVEGVSRSLVTRRDTVQS